MRSFALWVATVAVAVTVGTCAASTHRGLSADSTPVHPEDFRR